MYVFLRLFVFLNPNVFSSFVALLYCHFFTDSYSEIVPGDGPPSFRGQSVKYVYKLTIGCQRVNSPIKLLRVPFRVLVLQGEMITQMYCICGKVVSLPQVLLVVSFSLNSLMLETMHTK